ncbi:DNA-processing protein DprA [Neptunomonas japonica]|uniref:DNA processing protein n=1 Tax=Neptunomonas japonica JAMM 1380 TaxID=1441457 RepID=A0A7R6PDE4_9GAMM|nr:DNA-processing protein DprA [Neptunomonas japonica]BBB27982.1 DNA processing protein [Neptunomonas japonica JAMM 1380]
MPSDPKDWIAISQLPGIGPATLGKLFRGKWTPKKLIADQDSQSATSSNTPRLNKLQKAQLYNYVMQRGSLWDSTQQCVEQLQRINVQCLLADDDAYPALLREAPDHPVMLFLQGSIDALHMPMVSVVGSRNASAAGLRHAYQFSKALSAGGFVVTSGMALGIDGAAHQAAVDLGLPTVAVMGTGSDQVYPRRHQKLSEKILETGGALMTELLPGAGPLAAHFPRRNRIISGLSTGVLVVEAAVKSGSLITARMALNQGREVFALPGSIDHPGSRGCHALIREGAVLVESVDHMLDELSAMLGLLRRVSEDTEATGNQNELQKGLSDIQNMVLNSVDFSQTLLEEIIIRTDSLDCQLQSHLVELELLGWIEATAGGYQRIR